MADTVPAVVFGEDTCNSVGVLRAMGRRKIPTVLLHTVVTGRSRRIIDVLERESAGIVAEHAEKAQAEQAQAASA